MSGGLFRFNFGAWFSTQRWYLAAQLALAEAITCCVDLDRRAITCRGPDYDAAVARGLKHFETIRWDFFLQDLLTFTFDHAWPIITLGKNNWCSPARQLVGFPIALWGTWKMAGRFLGTSEPQSGPALEALGWRPTVDKTALRISQCHGHQRKTDHRMFFQEALRVSLARPSAWRKTCTAIRCFRMPGLLGSLRFQGALAGMSSQDWQHSFIWEGLRPGFLNKAFYFQTCHIGALQPGTESTWMISRLQATGELFQPNRRI